MKKQTALKMASMCSYTYHGSWPRFKQPRDFGVLESPQLTANPPASNPPHQQPQIWPRNPKTGSPNKHIQKTLPKKRTKKSLPGTGPPPPWHIPSPSNTAPGRCAAPAAAAAPLRVARRQRWGPRRDGSGPRPPGPAVGGAGPSARPEGGDVEVAQNRGTPNHPFFYRKIHYKHYKPSILGFPLLWTPPGGFHKAKVTHPKKKGT